jgi:8-oxo-dGTP diphosphatase
MSENEYPDKPRVAVGGIVFKNNRVLLVRRGKPPAEGDWAIPGGSVNLGETLQQAVERELLEETGITVKANEIADVFDVIPRDPEGRVRFHYVIIDLMADYVSGQPRPDDDVSDARWIASDELKDLRINSSTLGLLKKLGFV